MYEQNYILCMMSKDSMRKNEGHFHETLQKVFESGDNVI